MISKNLFSILCGILVWILGVSFYLLSFYVPILENPELQSNIALALGIIPSAGIGTYVFYTKSHIKPSLLGLTFVMVATLLDVIITVPVFIIPNGGSYSEFFGDPMFYTIVVEFYLIVFYFGKHLTQNNKK
ncbi:DUF5367 family protein [Hanstruepera marina]|uniref:DUF5367 family protein n=1 Tax=Hanstruepera marina TaxID=2873265 RepID=UPI001CA7288A|nr:DUF5367 family protein [Hanstruepera marina]